MKAKLFVLTLAVIGICTTAIVLRALSPKSGYAALSDSERQRIVDEVLQELRARGYTVGPFETVASFEYTSDRFRLTFTYGVDREALAIVRKHVDDLPLEVVDLILLRITTTKP